MWVGRLYLILLVKQILSCDISVDISTGIRVNNTYIRHNGIYFSKNHTFIDNGTLKGCICEYRTCLRKCCPKNQYYLDDKRKCVNGTKEVFPDIHDGEEKIEHGLHFVLTSEPFEWCNGVKYRLEPHVNEYDVFKLQKEGHLVLKKDGIKLEALNFCADFLGDSNGFGVIDCIPEESTVSDDVLSVGE